MFGKRLLKASLFSLSLCFSLSAVAQTQELGNLELSWNHGSKDCELDKNPAIQAHHYNDNFVIMRQNKCVNYEAPFMYLIFGSNKAILFDTGATKSAAQFPLQKTVEELLSNHYGIENRSKIELIVAHTHGHGDHVAGDVQFRAKPYTTVVGTSPSAVRSFFGFEKFPNGFASFDLGDRILEIFLIAGHEASHVAVYDEQTGILLSGDSLYPGRLYVSDWSVFRKSIANLTSFASGKEVSHILGAHIEQSKSPGVDYPIGTTYQPNEHDLPLTFETLLLLNKRLLEIGPFPKLDIQDDFTIYPN